MVFGRIRDALSSTPTLEGPSKLPPYFPVEPAGCEKHSQRLFECLTKEATDKARDMEKAGYAKSYYPTVEAERLKQHLSTTKDGDEKKESGGPVVVMDANSKANNGGGASSSNNNNTLPSPNDNPLDECRTLIAYYKRCCDRELKKKKNWILTEPYRVQEEYRYQKSAGGGGGGGGGSD